MGSCYLNRFLGAYFAAGVATRAKVEVNFMPRVGSHRDGMNGAMLRAKSATCAGRGDLVLDKSGALSGRTMALQVSLIFAAEIAQGREDRIGRRFSQAAQTARSQRYDSRDLRMSKIH